MVSVVPRCIVVPDGGLILPFQVVCSASLCFEYGGEWRVTGLSICPSCDYCPYSDYIVGCPGASSCICPTSWYLQRLTPVFQQPLSLSILDYCSFFNPIQSTFYL